MSQKAFVGGVSCVGGARGGGVLPGALVPAWAIGETRPMSERERRLTAAVYAQIPGVLEHVRGGGRGLPARLPGGGRELGLRVVVRRRGIDLELTEAESEVFAAIGEGELAGGRAILIGETSPRE